MDTIRNNTNFKARLNISDLKVNTKRWNKIAKEFEHLTNEFPKDEFSLSKKPCYNYKLPDDGDFIFFARTKKSPKTEEIMQINGVYWGEIKASTFERIEQMTDSELVHKLVNLFKITKEVGSYDRDVYNFVRKYKNYLSKSKRPYYSSIYQARKAMIENLLKKDEFLYSNRSDINICHDWK